MSSLLERERARLKARAKSSAESGGLVDPDPMAELFQLDPDRPKPDDWYVKMMVKRLEAYPSEPREKAIDLFRGLWPRLADRAEEFYDRAVALREEAL